MPDFTPRVSVIIPVYNGQNTITACLESLLNQTYPDDAYEIIVVENGSTDQTTAVVQRYPVRLLHSVQRGPAAARNLGIASSQAEIIAFTDADCIATPDWLRELVRPYADPATGGVGGPILAYQHAKRSLVEMFSDEHSPLVNFISGDAEFLPHLYTANASYRRALLNQVNGFNPAMITGEDVDLAWRAQLQAAARLSFAPEAVIYHHHRSSLAGLARQYRQYGFGEILLDTLYGGQANYPRTRAFQVRRMLRQTAALPRYLVSAAVRRLRLLAGRATVYQAAVPLLWFVIEFNNLRGKLEGMRATRLMTRADHALGGSVDGYIRRYY